MNAAPAEPITPAEPPLRNWSRQRLIFSIALVFAVQVALIFVLETKKPIIPRPVNQAPHLQLADDASELIALGDPTLFARPNAHDFVSAFWQQMPPIQQPDFNWTEAPRYLPPAPEKLGAAFLQFMQTNRPPETPLDFKLEPKLSEPVIPFAEAMPQATTMQITGDLAQRRRLNQIELPTLPWNDVIAPSKVQAWVDTAGNVASTVLLESSTLDAADQRALQLAGSLRFAPAPRLMFGEITFTWHTVPTNAP
jgi:hypothetical protein